MISVVSSSESAARDAAAIAAGIPSRALMERAGAAAAAEIALRFHDRLDEGVLVLAGPGNNGGDAWVVARALALTGAPVFVIEPVEAKTDDARFERALALAQLPADRVAIGRVPAEMGLGCGIVVDGIFGTGGRSEISGPFVDVVHRAAECRARHAALVALDIVSGIDATTGAHADACAAADLTIAFGTMKRGHLVNRDLSGAIVVVDIGLGVHGDLDDRAPRLVDDHWAEAHLPRTHASTHKGERRKLAIVGGHAGMAGAAILAARGAFRTGVGMVKLFVAPESLPVIQEAEPQALAAAWPLADAAAAEALAWADCVVIGPGLGRDTASRATLERVLKNWHGPTLLDADALTLFEHRADELASLLGGRPALITPHVVEFARVSGVAREDVEPGRYDIATPLAQQLAATVLLKGVPTVITSPAGDRLVSATGTPALGTGGSGDVLSGIAGTLLAQIGDPLVAGALGAFAHGRAAERTPSVAGTRGTSLDDVVASLRGVWDLSATPYRYPVLAEIPGPVW